MGDAAAVLAWLRSEEGRRVVRRVADRHGVAYLVDDLVSDVVYRTQVAVVRGEVIDNVGAWASRLLQRVAVDILRGERRRPRPLELVDESGEPADVVDEGVTVEAGVAGDLRALEVRRTIGTLLVPSPWVGAAGLARLAYSLDGADAAAVCPRPVGGAGPQEAADWAALWYAGRDECFPVPGEAESAAVRKRRSRATARVRRLLADAMSAGEAVGHG